MRQTGKENIRRKGRVFLTIEIDPKLREDMHLAAQLQGKTLKEWFPGFLEEHLPKLRIVATR